MDKDKLVAEYRNGILEIAAPISAAALPRKIEVKTLTAALAGVSPILGTPRPLHLGQHTKLTKPAGT